MLRPHTPLFNVATDASNGGGATVAPGNETFQIATQEGGPAVPVVAEPPKPGVIAQATALLRGANGNAATIAALRGDLTARDATIAALQADLATRDATITGLTAELQTFRAQAADLQTVVQTLESQRTDVQTEVIHQLAAAGLPEAQLPKGSSAAAPTATAEELWQQAEAASDPKEKGRLAAQALKLTEGKVHSLN